MRVTTGFFQFARPHCQALQGFDTVEAFDMQADGGDARVFERGDGQFGQARLRLVSRRHDIGKRQAAHLHGDIAGNVGGLGENGDAAFDTLHAMLVGPEQGAVERVDEAVAIGADDRHVTGGCNQRILQVVAICQFADGLAEPGGIADGAACTSGGQIADDLDGELAV